MHVGLSNSLRKYLPLVNRFKYARIEKQTQPIKKKLMMISSQYRRDKQYCTMNSQETVVADERCFLMNGVSGE